MQFKLGLRGLIESSNKYEMFKCKKNVFEKVCRVLKRMSAADLIEYKRCFTKLTNYTDKVVTKPYRTKLCEKETELTHYNLYKPTFYYCCKYYYIINMINMQNRLE